MQILNSGGGEVIILIIDRVLTFWEMVKLLKSFYKNY